MRRVNVVAAVLVAAGTIITPVSNAAPAAITETVYVESTTDSDADGVLDRIAADVMRPDTAERVPIVMEASPYYGLGAEMASSTVPRGFKRWYDEYFVPRGYAVVEMEMQGTSRSTGCPTTGGPEDTASVRAVVDWLNGRAKAFYADGRPAVASWSTGNVGMLGVSYNGTLPNAAAAAGIPGVKTIVPIAAISSWYEYSRDQGIAYRGTHANNYPTYLANYVVSAAQKTRCQAVRDRLAREDGDETFDYTSFWKTRDYRQAAQNVSASVFVVHGQGDWNVKPSQFGRWWKELADRGVARKIWLHRGGHLDPISFRQTEWQRVMGLWMDHWLKGVDNGIMREPMADVQKPDGSWEQHAAWPQPGTRDTTMYFGPASGGFAGSLTATPGTGGTQRLGDNANLSESAMMANPEVSDSRRLVYVTAPLKQDARLSGEVRLTARVASNRPSTPLTALLVDYGPSTQAVLTDRSPIQLSTETCTRSDLRDRTGCARPPDVSVQAVTATLLTRGAIDAKNRSSLETSTPLPTTTTADVSWRMHARDALIPAGHRIGVVIVTNHGQYVATDTGANGISLNVSLGVSNVVLPIVGGAVIT